MDNCQQLDAIFIPSNGRIENLLSLLKSLSWYKGSIFVLSADKNYYNINSKNISVIDPNKTIESNFIKQLKTFGGKYSKELLEWDLPLKRNYALLKSRTDGFKNILIIDDDITNFNETHFNHCLSYLKYNQIVGSLIMGFPDTSVIGHLEILCGYKYNPFLSGSFLFINVEKSNSLFPLIYNEDWIFMIPSIANQSIISVNQVSQLIYNPFTTIRVIQQEFGEIITEGLFNLIKTNDYHSRFDSNYWDYFIDLRKSELSNLKQIAPKELRWIPQKALYLCDGIGSNNCLTFIEDWENDLNTFKTHFENEK